ncbi:GspH/FimT family pseudopilin [Undibacterium oligocarboniphilum]|uniref:Type II secretion system protein H n=1 Tax=Undibacterium oligocarboniphilum TaxID=666702 RepID=A0A850QGJ8_9BURK|nr:GspH/FimT family pseudopilin [Undibacterium oligocarboniphilum]MBC3870498.1 GspH/FimT family pseudopilin [Undibacterium oligocarboniphilum]NVO78701.1 GspH/FimT family pseudopilin [Undibacterium oligocarboniphilum]
MCYPDPSRPLQRYDSFGFTLVEMLTAIAIMAILSAIAAPAFRDFIAGQKIKTATYDLSYTLTFARSEAIKRNSNVTIAAASGGWQNGWAVNAGTININQHESVPGLTITGPGASIIYSSNGRIQATANQTFAISSTTNPNSSPRCITINLSGLPNTKKGACS